MFGLPATQNDALRLLARRPANTPPPGGVQRGPATYEDAVRGRLWQEPEEDRYRASEPVPAPSATPFDDPLNKVGVMPDQKGLFDSDEDLAAFLARLTQPQVPQSIAGNFSLAPNLQAAIQAHGGQQPGGNASLAMGPLSLSGGLDTSSGQATPTFGAGLKLPLGGGDASARLNITPDQMKQIELAYRHKLFGGDIGATFNYAQPSQGNPSWGVGVRGRIPF